MSNSHKILKSTLNVSLATTLSRILGYVRDASLAWVLGAGFSMDAFTVAYRIANFFRRLVGEGAVNSSFVPVAVEYQKQRTTEELWDFVRRFFYTLGIVTAVIVAVQIIFAPLFVRIMAPGFVNTPGKFELAVLLTRIMAPYLLCMALAAVLMGVLNSFGHFVLPALNSTFFNFIMIAAALVAATGVSDPAIVIAFGVLLGGIAQVVTQIPTVLKQGGNFRFGISFHDPAVRRVGILLLPSIFGIGIVQVNILVDSLMASFLREGSVSQLYYADRVMELVLGVFAISFATVILPSMAHSASSKNMEELKKTLMFSLRTVAFVTIPATVGLVILANPIINVLFERGRFTALDTERTAFALIFYGVGLYFISCVRMIVSAFYSLQDTKTPVKVAFVSLMVNIVLNYILMHPMKQGGIALATSIAAAVSVVQLMIIFQKRHGALDWAKYRSTVARIGIASVLMGVTCFVLLGVFHFRAGEAIYWKVLKLFGTITAAIVVYGVSALALKAEEGVILAKVKEKLLRK